MMEDDIRKPVRQKKASSAPVTVGVHPPAGELTCSEGQVEDLLAEGESTEAEETGDQGQSQ